MSILSTPPIAVSSEEGRSGASQSSQSNVGFEDKGDRGRELADGNGAGAGGRLCQKALREDCVRGRDGERVVVGGVAEGVGRECRWDDGERAAAKRILYVFSVQDY